MSKESLTRGMICFVRCEHAHLISQLHQGLGHLHRLDRIGGERWNARVRDDCDLHYSHYPCTVWDPARAFISWNPRMAIMPTEAM